MRDDTEDYRRRVRAIKEGRSPLAEDEQEAREIIEEYGERFLRGQSIGRANERKLRNALALVRRKEKMSAAELRLRARRGWIA